MLGKNVIDEIDKLLYKVGYKINNATYDYSTETINIKAKNVVNPVVFPDMKIYQNDIEKLRTA